MRTFRDQRARDNQDGAALIEFTIVAGLLFMLVFGIIEFGLAFRDRLTISNASQGAVRVGSALGDKDESDFEVLLSLEQSLSSLPDVGVIKHVDIYLADANGNPTTSCPGAGCNRYTYQPSLGCDWSPCPDPATYASWPWPPSARDVALPDLDVMGVEITFAHEWITGGLVPLPNVDCDGSAGAGCWADTAVMRLEPLIFEP